MSVVARPTRVSVVVGNVNVPTLTIVAITGAVRVLFVKVCVAARRTIVSFVSGNVIVRFAVCENVSVVFVLDVAPDMSNSTVFVVSAFAMTGCTRVLLLRLSVVARPTIVSVAVGRVNVPPLMIVAITGAVKVLLVRVSVVVRPTSVSVIVGYVKEILVVFANTLVMRVDVVAPESDKAHLFVGSIESANCVVVSKVLFDRVATDETVITVSVMSGKVIMRFAVC